MNRWTMQCKPAMWMLRCKENVDESTKSRFVALLRRPTRSNDTNLKRQHFQQPKVTPQRLRRKMKRYWAREESAVMSNLHGKQRGAKINAMGRGNEGQTTLLAENQ